MKKFFLWMKDVGGFAAYIALTIMAIVAGIAYLSVIFRLNNIYSNAVHAASGWFHILGWALTAGAIYLCYTWTKRDTDKGDYWFLFVLLVLSWWSFTGFTS